MAGIVLGSIRDSFHFVTVVYFIAFIKLFVIGVSDTLEKLCYKFCILIDVAPITLISLYLEFVSLYHYPKMVHYK